MLMLGVKNLQQLRLVVRIKWAFMLGELGFPKVMSSHMKTLVELCLREVDLNCRCRVYHLCSRSGVHSFLVFIAPVAPIELKNKDIKLLKTYMQQRVSEQLFLPISALRLVLTFQSRTNRPVNVAALPPLGVPLKDEVRTCIRYRYSTTELQRFSACAEATTPSHTIIRKATHGKQILMEVDAPAVPVSAPMRYPVLTDQYIPKPSVLNSTEP
jgi:hypothetical protein